ncbi:MAG: trypsin-like peptidase domain-containing protein, partial [Alphaproteobacteria bacterium]|nr:trypsin-like peptidase domain-containing protein [Alphaproteobacteria bacterium]
MTQPNDLWNQLSSSFSSVIQSLDSSVLTVHSGHRSTASAIVWRDGIIVTVRHALHRRAGIRLTHHDLQSPISAELAGSDPATDLAILRADTTALKPVTLATTNQERAGDIVLSIGRSRLGDLSASSGIIARIGAPWRTWSGGNLDRLIRPDLRLYVGLNGSALVNSQAQVIGINNNALARNAVITVPAATIDRVVNTVLEHGKVPRPYLGLAMQPVPVPESLRPFFSAETEAALLVTHVEKDGSAEKAGFQVGDIVNSIAGTPITSIRQFQQRLL